MSLWRQDCPCAEQNAISRQEFLAVLSFTTYEFWNSLEGVPYTVSRFPTEAQTPDIK